MSIYFMKTKRSFLKLNMILLTSICSLYACAPTITPLWETSPIPFRPPTSLPTTQPLDATPPVLALFTPQQPTPTATSITTAVPCTSALSFVDDITVEDGASYFANAAIDKQWLVQNSGTCNWDASYRLKWVGGSSLGAAEEQHIYPARAGTQATLRILFTAPAEAGSYESAWQAVDPRGIIFGDLIFIEIIVTP